MGNIQNRRREYESGLNSVNVNTLVNTGRMNQRREHEPVEDFIKRAVECARHFQELEEDRKDPRLKDAKKYILERGW